jgi:F-type H+-transporting ATPase subunit delta
MSESITIARPYAKAIFEHALAEKKLAEWSEYLSLLAQAVMTPQLADFIKNPASTSEQHIEILQAISALGTKENKYLHNLISLLAHNKRLTVLPEIKALYEEHKAAEERTLDVDVISFSSLSPAQQQQMADSLSRRLQRQVSLHISIDPSLLGGAIIRAGNLVIDGSVRSKLNTLGAGLAA